MSKRKTRRYGSPPEVHRARAGRAFRYLKRTMADLAGNLRVGDCREAFDLLINAQAARSSMMAERRGARSESRGDPRGRGTNARLFKLTAQFRRKCMK